MYTLEKAIKNTIILGSSNNFNESIHICYGIDNNFVRGSITSIASIIKNNPNKHFSFHIIISNLTNYSKSMFEILAKQYSLNIYIYEIDINIIAKIVNLGRFQISLYYRFIFPLILKDTTNKCIYIDADIVCLNNADELFNIYLNNNIIAAIPDTINTNKERFLDKKLSILNPSTHQYFNAGLLAINIPYWNKLNISENAINMLNSENFQCKDQDVLNILCTNQIKYLPKEYNCINLSEIKNIKNIVFLHLTISPKPWFLAYQISPYFDKIKYDYYMTYEKFTPYKDIPLQEPKTYKELEHYSKMLRKAGYPLQSIKYYFKYLITKVLKK